MTFIKENGVNSLIMEGSFSDGPLHSKIGLRRKLLGTLTGHLIFASLVTSVLNFTPLARFYINENEWIFQLQCILIVFIHIALLLKRNQYKINAYLLFMHMFLQTLVVAVFVTYYDSLGVLQGLLVTTCVILSMFLYLFLFKKSFDFYIVLSVSCLVLLTAAMSFQMIFGCTFEEFITSVAFSMCLSFYYIYSVNLTVQYISYDKYCIAVINIYTWPFISLSSKVKLLI